MRQFPDWLTAYVKYASVTEAPKKMHAWAGVGAIAGALRRRVWIDMKRFTWYPSFYIVYVAPPGIVAKSTTADIAMDLLRQVPGVKFGPNSITWQALVTAFAAASEQFQFGDSFYPMSPLTFVAAELGSLVNLQDRDMVNLLIELWDGKKAYEKITKTSGNDVIEAPWINLQGCTTPHWIADNMPPATIGGGLSSRCVFVYAAAKDKYVAFVDEVVEDTDLETRRLLIEDLERISLLVGPYEITQSARRWEKQRYEAFWKEAEARMDNKMLEGYAARKQTHLFKLALVLSAARGDSMKIDLQDVELAHEFLGSIEEDMPLVFSRIGRSSASLAAERLVEYVRKNEPVRYDKAYQYVHGEFPDCRDFEGIIAGLARSSQVIMNADASGFMLSIPRT